VSPTTTDLRAAVLAAAATLLNSEEAPLQLTFERPPRADLGDYSTNAALLLAPRLGSSPREVAQRLGEELRRSLGPQLERYEVAGPGFLNLFVDDSWLAAALAGILAEGERFGAGDAGAGERVLVEFVSANPTGPMHVGHARNAAYGDVLARLLSFRGEDVTREFYVNDAGTQVGKLGESVLALIRGGEVPEDGYRGEYVGPLAERVRARVDAPSAWPPARDSARGPVGEPEGSPPPARPLAGGEGDADDLPDAARVGAIAVELLLEQMRSSLAAFGVVFDSWAHESALHEGDPSPVGHALELLERAGHTYRSEGALWLRTTAYGDDKDRVLVRSDGAHTYFASDIAYHQDKRERGFQRQIDVWGADHHGYVGRMKAAYEALGGDPEHVEMLIMQLVHLVRRGERAQMSKRAGEFVTLDDLLAEIGVDAARWFLLSRSHDTTIDLDLDLAREQSSENPVYYVQYAHARISSVLAKAGGERVGRALAEVGGGERSAAVGAGPREDEREALAGLRPGDGEPSASAGTGLGEPLHASERGLIEKLLAFPEELHEAARRRAPHRIASYALELAQEFTAFYRDCHVLDVEPPARESLRIALSVAAQRVLARSLGLLGVSAPEAM
jgi:arginyl-tRNA synthetase